MWVLNYIKHWLILVSTITGCIFISASASSVGLPVGITSSAEGSKICVLRIWYKNMFKEYDDI